MVEVGLVLPLLAVVVFGFVDLGRAYRLKTRLTNAAHEGAAYAQYSPNRVGNLGVCADPDNIVYAARYEEGVSSGFTVTVKYTTQLTESPPAVWIPIVGCSGAVPAARVVVTASAPFQLMTPLMASLVGNPVTLQESAEVLVP